MDTFPVHLSGMLHLMPAACSGEGLSGVLRRDIDQLLLLRARSSWFSVVCCEMTLTE